VSDKSKPNTNFFIQTSETKACSFRRAFWSYFFMWTWRINPRTVEDALTCTSCCVWNFRRNVVLEPELSRTRTGSAPLSRCLAHCFGPSRTIVVRGSSDEADAGASAFACYEIEKRRPDFVCTKFVLNGTNSDKFTIFHWLNERWRGILEIFSGVMLQVLSPVETQRKPFMHFL
jgi:hypothetical protein